jgi:hypothetical protein
LTDVSTTTVTNARGNSVTVFDRAADDGLTRLGTSATGGLGAGNSIAPRHLLGFDTSDTGTTDNPRGLAPGTQGIGAV